MPKAELFMTNRSNKFGTLVSPVTRFVANDANARMVPKAIRSTYEGQDAIRRLATDSSDALSGLAATHALWFDREFGSQILARLAGMKSEAGLAAGWTLRELSRGALDLDW